jgi:hypothetical protein
MKDEVVSGEKVNALDLAALPEGDYPGVRSGYAVECEIQGVPCRLTTTLGVRGINVPCTVRVRGGKVSVGPAAALCEHDKCFAPFVLTSDPPQYPWVCRRCGARGTDRGASRDAGEYGRLIALARPV